MRRHFAALGKLALAQLYRETGRDAQWPSKGFIRNCPTVMSSTVPPGLAQIKLAEMYTAEGKTDDDAKKDLCAR